LSGYDINNVSKALLKKLKKYTGQETFEYDNIMKKSSAAANLAQWVIALVEYVEFLNQNKNQTD